MAVAVVVVVVVVVVVAVAVVAAVAAAAVHPGCTRNTSFGNRPMGDTGQGLPLRTLEVRLPIQQPNPVSICPIGGHCFYFRRERLNSLSALHVPYAPNPILRPETSKREPTNPEA